MQLCVLQFKNYAFQKRRPTVSLSILVNNNIRHCSNKSSITIITYFRNFNTTFLWKCSTCFMIAGCYRDFISTWEIWICREILLIYITHYFARTETLVFNEMFLTENMDETEKNIFERSLIKISKNITFLKRLCTHINSSHYIFLI